MMAENKTSKNMEIFAKYLEDNQEVAQRYAAMTPAEKKEFEENFFKQARVERLNQLNRGRNSDEWQLTLDNINMNVLTAMNKAGQSGKNAAAETPGHHRYDFRQLYSRRKQPVSHAQQSGQKTAFGKLSAQKTGCHGTKTGRTYQPDR